MNVDNPSSVLTDPALDFEVLPESLQTMLAEAVDEYVIAMEEGCQPDREQFLKKYPSIALQLNAYLNQVEWLQNEASATSGLRDRANIESSTGLAYEDFEIDTELGRGAMGIVYRAFQKSLQRWVAIKVLAYGAVLDDHRLQRFWREARIAGALEHPGIVSVYGFGRHKDVCFYAMSLVEGRSLDRHIRDAEISRATSSNVNNAEAAGYDSRTHHAPLQGQNRFRNIAQLVAQAADAIHAAHEAGVIHRDIKPSNLILDLQGRVKVTDFGLAIDTADLELTRSGEVVGTIRYMSPEQAAGKRGVVDQRSDVYCLGATLYELLTLKPPFDNDSLAEVVRRKEEGLLTPPRSVDSQIPRALQTIVLKAMRADPRDRYETARDVANDLRNFLDGQPISAVDLTIVEAATCWARRHTGIVLTGAIGLALLFTIAVIFNIAQKSQQIVLKQALAGREKNFQNAMRAVDQLGIQFAEKLELIPEATELRRDLLRSSLNYYADFLRESKDDASLTQAVAEAKWKAAQATAGLETLVEASRLYEDADKELAELVGEHPELLPIRAEMLSDWAMRYMGRYQGEADDPAKALSILERLPCDDLRMPPGSRALLKNNRAFVLAALGRTQDAIASASDAVDLLRGTSPGDSLDASSRSLCIAMLNLSQALDKAGQSTTALAVAEQCTEYLKSFPSLKAADEAQMNQLRAKAIATLAGLQWKQQGAQAAIHQLQSVVDIHARQLENWPGSIEFRWDLAIALNNLGMALSALEDASDNSRIAARQAFEKAYAIARAETEADSHNSIAAQRAANIQNNLGLLLRKMGLNSEAAESLQLARLHIERAVGLDPANENFLKSRDRIDLNSNMH